MKFFPCSLLLNDFALNLGFLVYRMEIPPTLKSSHRHSVAAIVTETSLIRKDVILSNVHYLPPRNPSDKECTMLLHQHQPRHDPLQIPQRPQTVCPKPQLQQNWNHCYTEERRSNLPRSGLGKCEEADERMGKEDQPKEKAKEGEKTSKEHEKQKTQNTPKSSSFKEDYIRDHYFTNKHPES